MMEEKNLVRLLVVESDVEANFVKGTLEDNGIPRPRQRDG